MKLCFRRFVKELVDLRDDSLGLPYLELGIYIKIYNYKKIIDIKDNFIEVKNYIIKGQNLKITFLNKDKLSVSGIFEEVIIKGDKSNDNKNKV